MQKISDSCWWGYLMVYIYHMEKRLKIPQCRNLSNELKNDTGRFELQRIFILFGFTTG